MRPDQWKAIRAIIACRTAVLGGHMDRCLDCATEKQPSYNSCLNRHCPKCQGPSGFTWVEARKEWLLPVGYFHCVFTLPVELRAVAQRNEALVYSLIFRAASETLLTLGHDPKRYGALLGITAVLHTWKRDLEYHPHVHCIVTGGGLRRQTDQWVSARGDFLFPVKVMGALFAGKVIAGLRHAYSRKRLEMPTEHATQSLFDALVRSLHAKSWVVYAKKPFGGPEQVLKYLGQYTHRVGISNHRILDVTSDQVTLATRDGKTAQMSPSEFIRRFIRHILPKGFVKIRHYGLWAAGNRLQFEKAIAILAPPSDKLVSPNPSTDIEPTSEPIAEPWVCPNCGGCRLERRRLAPLSRLAYPPRSLIPGPSG